MEDEWRCSVALVAVERDACVDRGRAVYTGKTMT